MPDQDYILAALTRIEGKVDTSLVNHAERIATLETKHDGLEKSVEKAEKWSTYKSLITYTGVMLSHLGLGKLGVKI